MIQGNYNKIIEKISVASGLPIEDIERRVEAKRAKLSGLISKEGAAQVVAAELGINFDKEKLKINELLPGMRKVNVVGKVINLFPVRNFNKNGKEGRVANFVIADETSNVKVVLWDINHIELIENGRIQDGSVVEIINGNMRESELHLGSFSEFKPSDEILSNVHTEKIAREKQILDFRPSEGVSVRAFIVQTFEPKFFHICPECRKKAVQEGESFVCVQHGKVAPERRALMSMVVDDGTSSIRSVVFHDTLSSLGITELENPSLLSQQRVNLLGKEMVFSGNIRNNKIFNNQEFVIDKVDEINLDELISKLEKN